MLMTYREYIKFLLDPFYSLSPAHLFLGLVNQKLNPNIPIGSNDMGTYINNNIIVMSEWFTLVKKIIFHLNGHKTFSYNTLYE